MVRILDIADMPYVIMTLFLISLMMMLPKKEFGFVAYYILDDKVVGACSLNRDPIIAQVAEIMNAGKIISGSELKQAINSDINEIMTAGKISGSDTNTKLLIQKYLTG